MLQFDSPICNVRLNAEDNSKRQPFLKLQRLLPYLGYSIEECPLILAMVFHVSSIDCASSATGLLSMNVDFYCKRSESLTARR